jgi:tripartite-type tricarboxylate transporter receptor subunit TctC
VTALPVLPAAAQEKFPDRIINFVVPFSPGGPTDAMARLLAAELTKELGQSVVVDNRAGAGGNIGAEAVAARQPDGYNILFGTSGPLAINHSLYRKSLRPAPASAGHLRGLPAQRAGGAPRPGRWHRAAADRQGKG